MLLSKKKLHNEPEIVRLSSIVDKKNFMAKKKFTNNYYYLN